MTVHRSQHANIQLLLGNDGINNAQEYNGDMSIGTPSARCILHADLDAFYASVEQMDNPELRGRPVLVGGSPQGRGVVAACSYEARTYGIHSAMPMGTALGLCPQAIVVAPRFERYSQVSSQVMTIFRSITPLVQPLSMDEAYLDVTEVVTGRLASVDVAIKLKNRIKEEVGLTISIGVATSKAVAKIASEIDKPDGLVVLEPGMEQGFLAPLPVKRLAGIGPRSEQRLKNEGIATLGDLAIQSKEWSQWFFGKRGPDIIAMSRGEDRRPVTTEHVAKSISAETTFAQDIQDPQTLTDQLVRLSQRVARRLQRSDIKGLTVTVKLRLSDFTTFTRATTLALPVSEAPAIHKIAQVLVNRELLPGRRFRLLGVGVSNFNHTDQLHFFDILESGQTHIAS